MNDLTDWLKRFVALSRRKKELEEELNSVTLELRTWSDTLAEDMAMAGLQNAKIDGATVFIRTDRFVTKKSGKTMEEVCEILRACDMSDLVGTAYNANSLKARIREMQDEGEPIPDALQAVLNIGEVQRVVATGLNGS